MKQKQKLSPEEIKALKKKKDKMLKDCKPILK